MQYVMQYDASHQHLVYVFCLHLYISPLNIYLTAYLNSNIPAFTESSVLCNSRQPWFLEDLYQQIDIIYVPSLTQSQKTAYMSHSRFACVIILSVEDVIQEGMFSFDVAFWPHRECETKSFLKYSDYTESWVYFMCVQLVFDK